MSTWTIREGDVLDRLKEMASGSVQCVVTSPPYWGLRDYGVAGMIGLEPTLAEHLAKLVEVFGEVRRVLRDDGTLWLNYGDAYSGSGKGGNGGLLQGRAVSEAQEGGLDTRRPGLTGLVAKQRLLMPARVALALQDSGWWVRSEIVWAKGVSFCPTYSGSCMPSSVRDRPTDSHEMLYLMTKKARYFYDADAVRESWADERKGAAGGSKTETPYRLTGGTRRPQVAPATTGRNVRTVWTINPQAYSEAHFATFPEALVRPCLLAGTSERGACVECGTPWRRVVDVSGGTIGGSWHDHSDDAKQGNTKGGTIRSAAWNGANQIGNGRPGMDGTYSRTTTGWEPTCTHTASTRPCIVLDPFSGSGTVGVVAAKNGLSYVGIELSPKYAAMSRRRIADAAPSLFCREEAS